MDTSSCLPERAGTTPSHTSRPRGTFVAVLLALAVALALGPGPQAAQGAGSSTKVGGTVYKKSGETTREAFRRVESTYGGDLGAVRVFFPGMPAGWSKIQSNYGRTPMIVSFKAHPAEILSGKHDQRLRSWFREAPTGYDIWWSYWHEPENDIPRKFSAHSYRRAWQHIERLSDASSSSRLHATLTIMCWTLARNSGRDWRDYYAGDSVIDAFGFDCYNGGHRKGRYRDVRDILEPAAALSRKTGKPWGVGELGSILVGDDNGTKRARWLREYVAFAKSRSAKFVTYFDSKKNIDYRLHDRPSRSAWRDLVSDSTS